MLLSICVYTSLAAILFALGWHVWKREEILKAASGQNLPFWSWEIVLSILVFAAVAGARYHTGYDHAMYLQQYVMYQKYGFFTREFEPLFLFITQFFSGAHLHFFFYFAFWAAIQWFFICYAVRNNKSLLPWLALYAILGPFFLDWMNTMRQGVVEAMFVFAIDLIQRRKFLWYLLLVTFGVLLHQSALILLFCYFIPAIEIRPKIALPIMLVSVIIGTFTFWSKGLDVFCSLLHTYGYSRYDDLFIAITTGANHPMNWGPVRIVNLLIPCVIVLLNNKVKNFFAHDKLYPYYVLMAVIWFCASNVLINTAYFMTRPFEYFKIFILITSAYLLAYLYQNRYRWLFLGWLAISCCNLYFDLIKSHFFPISENIPFMYHFFFCS